MQGNSIEFPPRSVAVVLGTRPEIIKLAEVIRLLGPAAMVVHTGQHYDFGLSASFLEAFQIDEPSRFLGIGGQTRAAQIGSAVTALSALFDQDRPSVVVVQGDTNTTLAGALTANSMDLPLVHVEAGLRSRDRRMPEEHNRVLTDHLGDLLCAPTEVGRDNLIAEGIEEARVVVTGNTIVEAVDRLMPSLEERRAVAAGFGLRTGEFVLSTFHRPENVDDPARFATILRELGALPFPVLLPLHPRSHDRAARFGLEPELGKLEVTEPIGYRDFLALSAESAFLVSDSGGIQEEASIYKRPVVVVRRSTERPEVLGTFARLAEPADISATVREWLVDLDSIHRQLAELPCPYGDGSASARVVEETVKLVASA